MVFKNRLTKRVADVWESARFRSIFLASGFSTSQTLSTPAHAQLTQAVSRCEGLVDKRQSSGPPNSESTCMGLLTFSLNLTLDGCVDHQEGIADDETHAFFTQLMDEGGAMLWGRVTYEMMES